MIIDINKGTGRYHYPQQWIARSLCAAPIAYLNRDLKSNGLIALGYVKKTQGQSTDHFYTDKNTLPTVNRGGPLTNPIGPQCINVCGPYPAVSSSRPYPTSA